MLLAVHVPDCANFSKNPSGRYRALTHRSDALLDFTNRTITQSNTGDNMFFHHPRNPRRSGRVAEWANMESNLKSKSSWGASFPSHEANIPTLTPPAQALNGFNNIAILLSNFYMRLAHVLYARSCISAQSGLTRISNKSLGRYEVIASYFTQASETGVTPSEDERLKQLQDAKRKRRTEWKRRQGVRNL